MCDCDALIRPVMPGHIRVKQIIEMGYFNTTDQRKMARNIVIISQWNNNEWLSFTWSEYANICPNDVPLEDILVLNNMVIDEYLSCQNGVYSIQAKFIEALTPCL